MVALLENPDIVAMDNVDAALHRAVLHGQPDLASLFLTLNANPNVVGTDGNTPLPSACLKGLTGIAGLLLSNRADAREFSNSGTRPLHDAVVAGHAGLVSLLLDHGASVEDRTRSTGETALYFAAAWNRVDVVSVLRKVGARTDVQDSRRRTQLDAARENGNAEIV